MALFDVGGVTNWTSLTKFIVPPGATVSCHLPGVFAYTSNRRLQSPFNGAIIFQANPTTIVCGHNIKPLKVKAQARSAKLFPKVFKLPGAK